MLKLRKRSKKFNYKYIWDRVKIYSQIELNEEQIVGISNIVEELISRRSWYTMAKRISHRIIENKMNTVKVYSTMRWIVVEIFQV